MALSVASYILAANIQDQAIRYQWDDWNEEQATEPISEEFLARLQGISQRAVVAFTCGAAEWIIHRFAALSDNPLPLYYLETAWAMILDLRYCGFTWDDYTHESTGWTGPVRRPLAIAAGRVEYAFQAIIEYGNPELSAGWLNNLAQYVLTDAEPYQKWHERVMERLEVLYRRDPQEKLGDVVPRQAVDPGFDFQVEQTESLINQFLAGLDHKSNPFLNSPERMREQGFEGTPYVFHFAQDRKTRFK
jgi:hypothetical protein